ncbi:MAG TPA: TIGR03619 family F420-dependent LLM class oxidoreductase [Acidimicrobiales bacterium]|nr:TIGR03619 family F420-dependent LLM class oxidoreductase [Acidimicrobiales bacterium]
MTDTALIPADVVRTVPEGAVVYGMQLPIQSQSTLYVADWEKASGPTELARIARVADESGFFYLGVCDHTAIPRRLADAMGTIWYDTTATLGWLAALTSRTHLLSHVLILAQRHPLRAAKELATIDHLSGGRLIVGVGAGHVPEEYEMLTGDFDQRGRHTDEAVSALARALTDEFPELPGPRFPARDMGVAPRPVRQPRPPIWIGGSSPAAIRRTAAFGDGWLPQGTRRRDLPGQIAQLRAWREEYRNGAPIDIGTIVEPIYLTGGGASWDVPNWALSGGAEEVATSLRELVEMGVNHLQVRFLARSAEEFCDQTARFGVEVAPLLSR